MLRCGGICRRQPCAHCNRRRCYGCASEAAELVRQRYAQGQPPKPELNPSLDQVLRWVHAFIAKNRYSPSIEEIAQGCGYKSTSSVQMHLLRLEARGYVTRQHGSRVVRSLALTEQGEAYCVR
jgi:DNA-binding MarR family transcriptional regulator